MISLHINTSASPAGVIVSSEHFGINHNFDYEVISNEYGWQSFDEVVENSSPTMIRYQGGSAAEKHFDIEDSRHFNSGKITRITSSNDPSVKITPLDKFLNFCGEEKIDASIIIPIKDMLLSRSQGNRMFNSEWDAKIDKFIKNSLAEAEEQGANIVSFEIGNEYETYMSSTEYGRIVNATSIIIQNAINKFKSDNDLSSSWREPDISVQVHVDANENGTHLNYLKDRNFAVMNEVSEDAASAIDSVTGHLYFKEGKHFNQGGFHVHDYKNIKNLVSNATNIMSSWDGKFGKSYNLNFSEWNVQHKPFGNISDLANFGLKQLPIMISMFDNFLVNNVQSLNFWSSQYHPTSLAFNNGTLTVAGELFRHMRTSLEGTRSIDLIDMAQEGITDNSFISEDRIIIYLSSRSEDMEEISINLRVILYDFNLTSATSFDVERESGDGSYNGKVVNLPPWGEGDLHSSIQSIDIKSLNGIMNYKFHQYELLALEFSAKDRLSSDSIDASINYGTFGADRILTDDKYVIALGGNDYVYTGVSSDILKGGSGEDTLLGGLGNDTLYGGQNDDYLRGGVGRDALNGNNGADKLKGGTGNDKLYGNQGNDSLWGGSGHDALNGNNGADKLKGGTGNDFLAGNVGDDKLYGEHGNDKLYGGWHNDSLWGGAGNDALNGNYGEDALKGGPGNDFLAGNNGNDKLYGDQGNDKLYAATGNDSLWGGVGTDLLAGGGGADKFVFRTTSDSTNGAATRDIIVDFEAGTDKLHLVGIDANTSAAGNQAFSFSGTHAQANSVWYVQTGSNLLVRGDNDGDGAHDFVIELQGINSLTAGDFIL